MSFELPEDARIRPELDVVALTNRDSYHSQLVRLILAEKDLKWKNKDIDNKYWLANLDPWFVNLNKKCSVPTILVHPNNKAIAELSEIIEFIDKGLKGS